jgi:eukaryotic-like serine/threonine-protein kinase
MASSTFGSDDANIYAADIMTGTAKWHYRTGGQVRAGVSVSGRTVFAGSSDGNVYAVRA